VHNMGVILRIIDKINFWKINLKHEMIRKVLIVEVSIIDCKTLSISELLATSRHLAIASSRVIPGD